MKRLVEFKYIVTRRRFVDADDNNPAQIERYGRLLTENPSEIYQHAVVLWERPSSSDECCDREAARVNSYVQADYPCGECGQNADIHPLCARNINMRRLCGGQHVSDHEN